VPAPLVGLLIDIQSSIAYYVLMTLTARCTVAYSLTVETDRASWPITITGLVWLALDSKASERLLVVVCTLRLRDFRLLYAHDSPSANKWLVIAAYASFNRGPIGLPTIIASS
jgi:hypothetical protein